MNINQYNGLTGTSPQSNLTEQLYGQAAQESLAPAQLPATDDEEVKDQEQESDETSQTPTTVLELINQLQEEIDSVRFNKELSAEERAEQLAPLEEKKQALAAEMQVMIKEYTTQLSNELFGTSSTGGSGTLLDYLA